MEGFEPEPQNIGIEVEPQSPDAAAPFEALLENEGIPPAQRESVRREAQGLLTRLGNAPLARKIYFAAAALSLMAAKEDLRPPTVAAQTVMTQEQKPLEDRKEFEIREPQSPEEAEQMLKEMEEALKVFQELGRTLEQFNKFGNALTMKLDNVLQSGEMLKFMLDQMEKLEEQKKVIPPINEAPQLPNSPDQG